MSNLGWGLQMTALGMGLVFGMLALLWGLLALALKLDGPPAAAEAESGAESAAAAPDETPALAASTADDGLPPALRAAITMAVLAHAAQQRGEAAPQVRLHWPGSLLHASRWVAAGRTRQNHAWRRLR